MSRPPTRLLDDPQLSPELRADLLQAQQDKASYDTEVGLAALQRAIFSQGGQDGGASADVRSTEHTPTGLEHPASPALSASAGLSLGGLKWAAAVATLVTGALLLWSNSRETLPPPNAVHGVEDGGERTAPAAPAPTTAKADPADAETNVEPAHRATERGATERGATEEASAVQPDQRETRAVTSGTRRRASADADAQLRAEIENLRTVRHLLATGDAAAAYRTAAAGQRRFGQGMLYEEREALSVLALSELGRDKTAERRGRYFLKRFPNSTLRDRVAAAITGTTEAP